MPKVIDVLNFLSSLAPQHYAMSFDNVGLLVGDGEREVSKILVSLDITAKVIDEAKSLGADLIVAHHPVIFEPLKRVVVGDITSNHVISLIENKISAICMHTNLDAANGGVNDVLADVLRISKDAVLEPIEDVGIGRVGKLSSPMQFDAFLEFVSDALKTDGLRYLKVNDRVSKVAVGGGSCGSMLSDAKAQGADTFVTADIKHSQWIEAEEMGLNLIDAGHFSTENVVIAPLAEKIAHKFGDISVEIAKNISEPMKYYKK